MNPTITIPGTISVADLARAIGRELEEVVVVLHARAEPTGPGDVVSGEAAVDVARTLGVEVRIEPRDLALGYLYAHEARGEPDPPEGRAGSLVAGVMADLDGLDQQIESVSQHWSVSRMPAVDRNILRIALYELESEPSLPTAVIISEAVRLASAYSTERSASFVNGVLSSLARNVRG